MSYGKAETQDKILQKQKKRKRDKKRSRVLRDFLCQFIQILTGYPEIIATQLHSYLLVKSLHGLLRE